MFSSQYFSKIHEIFVWSYNEDKNQKSMNPVFPIQESSF